jgi:PAS domain S-box-containing protein
LRKIVENDYDVPVVMVTGRGDEKVAVKAMKQGACDYVIKSEGYLIKLPLIIQNVIEKYEMDKEKERLKREIEETKDFLDNIIKSSADAIITADLDGKITSWSKGAEELYGYKAKEVIGKPTIDLYPSDLKKERLKWLDTLMKGGVIRNKKTKIYNKDEKLLDISLSLSLLKNSKGKPIGTVGVSKDISREIEAEEALRESEERYRRLVEHSPDGIAVHSGGKVVYLNKAGVKLMGAKSLDEIVGKPMIDFVHPDYREIVMERARQTQENGKEVELIEEKFIRLDGQTIDVEVVAIPTTYQDKPATQVVIRDITERKQAEEALRETEERLTSIIKSSEDIIVMQDLEGKYLYYNAPSRYGVQVEEVVGKTPSDIHKPEKAADIIERINKVVESGEGLTGEEESTLKGMCLWFHFQMSPIKDANDNVIATTTILRNITELKWAEMGLKKYIQKLEEANQMKGLFTDIMTHDLLSPAGAIRNTAELMLDEADDDQREMLEVIEWGAKKQMEIIELTSKLSKLESVEQM